MFSRWRWTTARSVGGQKPDTQKKFRLFRRRDRPSSSLDTVWFSVSRWSVPLRRSGVPCSTRIRVYVVPRSVHRAATVHLRRFVPYVHSGLLYSLHAEPAPDSTPRVRSRRYLASSRGTTVIYDIIASWQPGRVLTFAALTSLVPSGRSDGVLKTFGLRAGAIMLQEDGPSAAMQLRNWRPQMQVPQLVAAGGQEPGQATS
ncbi:hypothetical protein EVAR_7405_1 [Eumeta japonica]|uniref:Uncharacterized protein n=1 Tax=Eumeta variegata TaxID=151549 RepID=A0A4C1V6C5_EUMVA|nr:hypothetical protein EVAR_7405_1 [Eumeta japonica]